MRKNNWKTLKNYINSKNVGDVLTRIEMTASKDLVGIPKSTVDIYVSQLKNIKLLSKVKPGVYKIKYKIPTELTLGIMYKLRYKKENWSDWFMIIEDRIKQVKNAKTSL